MNIDQQATYIASSFTDSAMGHIELAECFYWYIIIKFLLLNPSDMAYIYSWTEKYMIKCDYKSFWACIECTIKWFKRINIRHIFGVACNVIVGKFCIYCHPEN